MRVGVLFIHAWKVGNMEKEEKEPSRTRSPRQRKVRRGNRERLSLSKCPKTFRDVLSELS